MSDTPRTDAFLVEGGSYTYDALADFAARLERELAATTKERDEWHDQVGTLVQQLFVAEQKISAVTKERDEWKAKAEANELDARYASSAADDVLNERERQINVEGWDESHDDEHDDESLALAAVCYAFPPNDLQINDELGIPVYWPDSWAYAHWKPKDRRRDLVRAAALIIAEIERLDRVAFSATSPAISVSANQPSGISTETNRGGMSND